ncbi:MAG TPA: helix-turn-helix domain-containing protein [Conexibacter sp.]|jgi:hypothetical protein
MKAMTFDVPDALVAAFAEAVATKLVTHNAGGPPTPWMTTHEAIRYSRIPEGTFRQLAASGDIPSHGGRSKVFHRDEVDAAIMKRARGSRTTR